MENKYFIPDIEDFRFGYEFERNYTKFHENWHSIKIVTYLDFEGLEYYIDEGLLRTPYLTKEQIEAEEWEYGGDTKYTWPSFKKGDYQMLFKNNHEIHISDLIHYNTKYHGECKSINEFRFICKLLNISRA